MAHATPCSIDGCNKPSRTRGWCRMHYSRWYRHGDPEHVERTYRHVGQGATVAEKVWSKIARDQDGCWVWQGANNGRGYGILQLDRQRRYAHRFVYEWLVEPIPEGLHLDHLCRNPPCCNPAHLEPVTCRENVHRGEGHGSEDTCPQGHPYDDENTYRWTNPQGHTRRYCIACRKQRQAA